MVETMKEEKWLYTREQYQGFDETKLRLLLASGIRGAEYKFAYAVWMTKRVPKTALFDKED